MPNLRSLLTTALTCLSLAALAPAHAWVPKLDEATAKKVISSVYGRSAESVVTFQNLDLTVKDGKFAAGDGQVRAYDGGEQCLTQWLSAPADLSQGSRVQSVVASGQADNLYFQAIAARDAYKNLSAATALTPAYAEKRLADGEVRIDLNVVGLPAQKSGDAYMVRLRGKGEQLIAPVRVSYVDNFKQDQAGLWSGTLVYYFRPLDAGIGATDEVEVLVRTEADTDCAYSFKLNLGSFQ